jgi:hypothetical protein
MRLVLREIAILFRKNKAVINQIHIYLFAAYKKHTERDLVLSKLLQKKMI